MGEMTENAIADANELIADYEKGFRVDLTEAVSALKRLIEAVEWEVPI